MADHGEEPFGEDEFPGHDDPPEVKRHHAAYEEEAIRQDLVDDAYLEYGEWLEATGIDPSFVGMPADGTPGTGHLYEAAVRVMMRRYEAERDAQASGPKP